MSAKHSLRTYHCVFLNVSVLFFIWIGNVETVCFVSNTLNVLSHESLKK